MNKVIGVIFGIVGILMTISGVSSLMHPDNSTVAIIGGADGPTSIFVAEKLGGIGPWTAVVVGLLTIAAAILVLKKKKK